MKNPSFYFGIVALVLFSTIYSSCNSFATYSDSDSGHVTFFNSFFENVVNLNEDRLFYGQNDSIRLETPDLKIVGGNSIGGIAAPQILSTKVLGDMFGGSAQNRREIIEYSVQPGDTLQGIASANGISLNTLLWANDLSTSSAIKVGQSLVILPADGVLHIVKSGDTLSGISQTYKSDSEDIITYNSLAGRDDIYIGDILLVPGGAMPKKALPIINNNQVPLADNFFIYPTSGRVSQGLHYYNAIDVANKCGTSVYAAASGVVQRVKYGYNYGGGNQVTILHSNGIVTYYGHLMTIFVKSGDRVNVGDRIALMGGDTGTVGDGISTGCHLHFQVMGVANPLAKYSVGAAISLK